ncbi:MAG: hypothetical protein BWY68_00874 [bacterium ADurb.Bin400]|nr:MAG: hypothetical protein BWY68_00874 [bacterium ADurb.Bin400]
MGDRSSEKISVAWHRNWIQKTISGDPALESIRLAKHEELYGAASPAITDHQQLKGEVFVDQPVPAGATEITYFLFNRRSPGDRERAIRQAERRLRRYIGRQARRLASSL